MAYLNLMSTDVADLAAAGEALAALAACSDQRAGAGARRGDRRVGGRRLERGGPRPRRPAASSGRPIVLALMLGHQLDFFTRRRRRACATVRCGPLRELDPQHPHAPFVRGMACVRLGGGRRLRRSDWTPAGQPSRPTPTTCGRIHAVVHTYEMQGRVDEGIAFLRSDETAGSPATCSPCTTGGTSRSTSWRPAAPSGRWRSTTPRCTTPPRLGVPIEMLDASALLWRLRSRTSTPAVASGRWPTRGRRRAPARRGTCSTTSTPSMAAAGADRLDDAAR